MAVLIRTPFLARIQDEEPSWSEIPSPAPRPGVAAVPPRTARPTADDPSWFGIAGWTLFVVALIAACFVLLKKFADRGRAPADQNAIGILGRRAVAPRQEVVLLAVGSRRFLLGCTRDRLVSLGTFEEPEPMEGEPEAAFRSALRDRAAATPPRDGASFRELADELKGMRKTVEGWRA